MMRFFNALIRPKSINQASLTEVQKAFIEIEKLQKNNDIESLKKALYEINEIEKKYPFCFDTARYYRGEVGSDLIDKIEQAEAINFKNDPPKL